MGRVTSAGLAAYSYVRARLFLVISSCQGEQESRMELSARNQLKGTVADIKLGAVMAEVAVDIGGQQIVAAITRSSVERLGLKVGDSVLAIMKATEVMIA